MYEFNNALPVILRAENVMAKLYLQSIDRAAWIRIGLAGVILLGLGTIQMGL
jgi:hypothetical protein